MADTAPSAPAVRDTAPAAILRNVSKGGVRLPAIPMHKDDDEAKPILLTAVIDAAPQTTLNAFQLKLVRTDGKYAALRQLARDGVLELIGAL